MLSILIIDDIEEERSGLKDFIDWDCLDIYVVADAANGLEGYRKALEHQPDIILTDVSMPVMDGIKMGLKLKTELPKADIIFMSCHDEFKYIKSAFDMGAYAYILKPIDVDELVATLQNVIEKKRHEKERLDIKKQLDIWKSEGVAAICDHMVTEMIFGSSIKEDDINRRLLFLNIPTNTAFSIIAIRVENYDFACPEISPEDKYLVINHIKKALNKQLKYVYPIVRNELSLVAMVVIDAQDYDVAMNQLMDVVSNAKEIINSLALETTIGIGGISFEFKQAPILFQQAETALEYRFSNKGDSIVFAPEIKEMEIAEFNIEKMRKSVLDVVESADIGRATEFVEQFTADISSYPENAVKSLCISLISTINTSLIDKNESLEKIFENENLVWSKLMDFSTIVDIKQWLVNILRSVIEYLNDSSGKRYKKIVEDIKSIIDQKYADVENINEITQHIYISASYANKIFKRYTNQTIFEYLVSKKMEAAKILLKDPYVKIYEVAEKVGYRSKAYFSNTFREYTGYLPKNYRIKLENDTMTNK